MKNTTSGSKGCETPVRAVQWQERRDDRGRGETAHAPRDPVVAEGGTLETGTQLQRQWNGLVVTTGALSVVARAEHLESRSYNTCRRPIQLRSYHVSLVP